MTEKNTSGKLDVSANAGGDSENNSNLQYMLNSPMYMSSVVRRQLLQEMVKSLPDNVQKRINALRNIELERLGLEAKFFEEVIRFILFRCELCWRGNCNTQNEIMVQFDSNFCFVIIINHFNRFMHWSGNSRTFISRCTISGSPSFLARSNQVAKMSNGTMKPVMRIMVQHPKSKVLQLSCAKICSLIIKKM